MKFETKSIHSGQRIDPQTGALTTPLYQSSTFSYFTAVEGQQRFAGKNPGYIYSRFANPTTAELEIKIADLEGAEESVVLASGMAAISATIYALTSEGDEIAYIGPLYGGTESLLKNTISRAGISIVEYEDEVDLLNNIKANTKLIIFETLTNPTLKFINPQKIVEAAKRVGAITVCDNTFLSPYYLRPIEFGVDVVIHSATKYLGGHGDIIAGVVSSNSLLTSKIRTIALKHLGAAIGPQEAYLLQRGIKTLPLRMAKHNENAIEIAHFLSLHKAVKKVIYPGLPTHKAHQEISSVSEGFGGMISIEIDGGFEQCAKFLDNLQLFTQAVSLGDLESLICHPASTTHAAISVDSREKVGVTDDLIRISIGIENAEDLIDDLKLALSKL